MSWIWIVLLVGLLANSVRLRMRARALAVLPPDETQDVSTDHRFLVTRGVWLPESARRSASAYARRCRLEVLDLVPDDLPTAQAMRFVRTVEPKSFRTERLAPATGAGHAVLVHREILERLGIQAGEGLEPEQLAAASRLLKSYAPSSMDIAVMPGLRAPEASGIASQRFWLSLLDEAIPALMAIQAAELLLLAIGLWVAPLWAVLGLVVFQLQPLVVLGFGPITPRDLAWQPGVRIVQVCLDLIAAVRDQWAGVAREEKRQATDPEELRRQEYAERLSPGLERFFEPRRSDCPLCHSETLAPEVEVRDLFQHKPGVFKLERCGSCDHIFQNPRLTIEGLDFYYKDFYDGAFGSLLDFVFAAGADSYRARAGAVQGHAEPRSWLDVGTGHGHFPLVAKEVWPATRFDGLDMGDAVQEAHRRGWIQRVYRDPFPEVAPKIEGQYDVVSMHHYLEHTPEPLRELDAAAQTLAPGGHLLIELPDPECFLGRWLGRRWLPWFQPQHLHFLTLGNLKAQLRERGFEPLAEERGAAHTPVDLAFAMYTLVDQIAPLVGMPWQARPSVLARVWRWSALIACVPLFAVAFASDQLLAAILKSRPIPSNTFRLLSRKRAG